MSHARYSNSIVNRAGLRKRNFGEVGQELSLPMAVRDCLVTRFRETRSAPSGNSTLRWKRAALNSRRRAKKSAQERTPLKYVAHSIRPKGEEKIIEISHALIPRIRSERIQNRPLPLRPRRSFGRWKWTRSRFLRELRSSLIFLPLRLLPIFSETVHPN